ncbi:MAG: putative transposase [Gammaproteobacteria bacterium]|jgi:putative transposase
MIPLGDLHLREVVAEYVDHYNHERNHQGRDNPFINESSDIPDLTRTIECRQRLGGILNYYYREAA